MPDRRKKPATLNQAETDRFIAAATELHKACCTPLLAINSDHRRVLTDLNQAVCDAILEITGRPASWIGSAPAGSLTGSNSKQ